MSGWSQTIIVGNVGRAPELRYLQSGVPVCNFTVAVNEVYGTGEDRKEKTTWYRVAAWRKLAEVVNQYVTVGQQVMVIGNVEANAFINQSGAAQASLELTARDVRFLGGRSEQSGGGGAGGNYDNFAPPPDDVNDIPF